MADDRPEPTTAEEAFELFLELRSRGETVSAADFAERHARFGTELRESLVAVEALEAVLPDARAVAGEVPERIGPYRVRRELGRGGMGVVFEAVEESLGRRVALKLLPHEFASSPATRARFRREAELAARLDHPGIATVYGTGLEDDLPWIAMRFVEGETLARSISHARRAGASHVRLPGAAADGRASVLAIVRCVAAVARALQFAHEQGVVHRDVKPSNIMVGPGGAPVLVDFGLAAPETPEGATLTRTGDTAGTPAYIAPEILSGVRARPDAQCDVYALGVTLYECLALRRPFEAPTPVALYREVLTRSATDVRSHSRLVPRDLALVVATALERERPRRYRDAAAFAADLERWASGLPITARPVPLHGRLLRWARREPRQALLAAMLAAATFVLAIFGGSWWSSRDQVHAARARERELALERALEDGYSSLDLDRPAEAEAAFARALELAPGDVEARVGRIFTGLALSGQAEARRRLADIPGDLRARPVVEAIVAQAALSEAELQAIVRAGTPIDSFIVGVYLQTTARRQTHSQREDLQRRALSVFTEAIVRSPRARSIYHHQRAQAAQQTLNTEAARSAASALVQLFPDSARSLFYAGRAMFAADPAAAAPLLERSLEAEPDFQPTFIVLAQAWIRARDFAAAEATARRGLSRFPESAGLHSSLGDALMQSECIEEGISAHETATRLDPKLPAPWAEIGLTCFVQGDDERARRAYERALELDPGNDRARLFYAALLMRSGELEIGRAELWTALARLYPGEASYWAQLSMVFRVVGSFEAACAVARAGLAHSPDDPQLHAALAEAQAAGGNAPEADAEAR